VLADNRARLVLSPGGPSFYFDGPAQPLQRHRGILFPYQPDITYSQSVNYTPYDLVHTNQTYNAYRNTPMANIQMTTQFASVTDEEARYTLGVLHFLRSVSKMFFGEKDIARTPQSGTPPPLLRFSAFGHRQFNNLPVVLESFSTTYDSGVDLKEIDGTQVPAVMSIFIQFFVQQNPDRQKRVFSTHDFVNGSMYTEGFI